MNARKFDPAFRSFAVGIVVAVLAAAIFAGLLLLDWSGCSCDRCVAPSSAEVHPLFEAKVPVLERGRGQQSAAIQRLRASKLRAERQQLINGRIDGREWVEDDAADYEALKRLEENGNRYLSAWDRP